MIDKDKLIGFANDVDREIRDLEEENAELKAELDYWKGNAEGFEPDAYMRLPLDADGVPIRIGNEVNIDGDAMTVLGYRLRNDMLLLVAEDKKSGLVFTPEPSRVCHSKPEPVDSWEQLEEDLNRCIEEGDPCMYYSPRGSCDTCAKPDSETCGCTAAVFRSIKERIRELAKKEGE